MLRLAAAGAGQELPCAAGCKVGCMCAWCRCVSKAASLADGEPPPLSLHALLLGGCAAWSRSGMARSAPLLAKLWAIAGLLGARVTTSSPAASRCRLGSAAAAVAAGPGPAAATLAEDRCQQVRSCPGCAARLRLCDALGGRPAGSGLRRAHRSCSSRSCIAAVAVCRLPVAPRGDTGSWTRS